MYARAVKPQISGVVMVMESLRTACERWETFAVRFFASGPNGGLNPSFLGVACSKITAEVFIYKMLSR